MDWKSLGTTIAQFAPALGGIFLGPAGAAAGALVAQQFGVENEPAAIEAAIKADPAAAVKLIGIQNQHIQALRKLDIDARQMELDAVDAKDARANSYLTTAVQSDDEYVRRTRPGILRDLFKVVAAMALLYPLALIGLSYAVSESMLMTLVPFFLDIFFYMASLFTVAFTGYSALRTVDKQNASGDGKAGVMGVVSNFIGKMK